MTDSPTATDAIETRGLSRSFGALRALDRVDLDVAPGESVALFGPNGAGKTTLIRILTLCLKPSAGTLLLGGFDPRRDDRPIRERIGLISHHSFLYDDLTARQNLEFFAGLYGVPEPRDRADRLLAEFGLLPRAEDAVRTFSRGMQQRLSLARALVHEPRLLFLDEPFNGLDPHAARMLRGTLEQLRGAGRTIVLVTHNLAEGLQLSDRWLILRAGRIAAEGRSRDTDAASFDGWYFEQFAAPAAAAPASR
jgi:heme exporter protein A